MSEVKFCRDCKHSQPEPSAEWTLLCTHPMVNKKDSYVLAAAKKEGSSARSERARPWTYSPPCGKAGKLWEQK